MLKTLGVILIIISSVFVGIFISKKRTSYINFLRDYIKLLLTFEAEIKYSQTIPLQILNNHKSGTYIQNYINKCIKLCESNIFQDAWSLAFSEVKKDFWTSEEEQNFIQKFGEQIGNSDVTSQINYCNYNINLTKSYLENATKNQEKTKKLPVILSISVGLIIVLIIL
ncbi:MAG: stage III sporulation protein AB [Clostridia bacterium]|nr:stage III sporulation protein AB [Clostridia bacterium]